MTDPQTGRSVNEHYLNKVIELADSVGVIATEDIVDTRGNKLLAKGAAVSTALQERLIVHRLKKPIESSLAVENGISAQSVVECAERQLDGRSAIAHIVMSAGVTANQIAQQFCNLKLGAPMTMMLTMIGRSAVQSLDHVVAVAMLSLTFAKRMKLSDEDVACACTAGILHDIGELYIDPRVLEPGRILSPQEWTQVVLHPHLGRLLITDLDALPAGVALAVSEHHERCNGTGYPRSITAAAISKPGQAVGVAEMVGSMLSMQNALARCELALKLVAAENPAALVSLVTKAMQLQQSHELSDFNYQIQSDNIVCLEHRIRTTLSALEQLARSPSLSQKHQDIAARTNQRLLFVERAFTATGLGMFVIDDGHLNATPAENFEAEVAVRELNWRLRNIARDIALQLGIHNASFEPFSAVMQQLDPAQAEREAIVRK